MSVWHKIFGDPNKRVLSALSPIISEINSYQEKNRALTDTELREQTQILKNRLAAGETLDNILPDAFAVVREAARRTIGQFHYDVQLMGGIVLHRGQIAEMRTGEGKTLTSTLPVYLHALTGQGVHVVTVNDYLAKRDAVWMGQIYHALGLSVGVIQGQMTSYVYDASFRVPEKVTAEGLTDQGTETDVARDTTGSFHIEMDYMRPASRSEAYAADITYGTNNEFGFDYLRDNMVGSFREMVQRPLAYAIIDEVDSILIDEARTPLIISAPAEEATDAYFKYAEAVRNLKINDHYVVDEKQRAVTLTDAGIAKMEQILGIENLYVDGGHRTVHHVESALRAEVLFKRDRDYVVKDGEVIIVDEFTGRLMEGRRYSEGLHQAIEAKENATIQRESETLATITFQNYFRLYERIAGMTGTAVTEAEEFGKIYSLEVVVIPPNKSTARVDLPDRIYATEEGKFTAVVREVKERHAKGQPVLIGTVSIDKNERLSLMLEREGILHNTLNAKNHEREGEIIAQAGRRGAVTLATNMAGRGVDIILGGNPPDADEHNEVKSVGGLFVLGTERHESRRIDNQLRGRSGRQGDPGETQFFISTEDDLMRIFGSERMKNLMQRLKVPDDMPIEHSIISKSIETAQKKVEGHHFDMRKHLLEYDDVLNRHREVIYKKRREVLDAAEGVPGEALGRLVAIMDVLFEQEIEHVVFSANAIVEEGVEHEFPKLLSALLHLEESEVKNYFERLTDTSKEDIVATRTAVIEELVVEAKKRLRSAVEALENPETAVFAYKNLLLQSIDALWIEHLEALSYMRTGIGLRGYGQRDPLVEYKKESYRLFQELLAYIQKDVVYSALNLSQAMRYQPSLLQRQGIVMSGAEKTQPNNQPKIYDGEVVGGAGGGVVTAEPIHVDKIGRNDPCPCGSGKKYKKCHGA